MVKHYWQTEGSYRRPWLNAIHDKILVSTTFLSSGYALWNHSAPSVHGSRSLSFIPWEGTVEGHKMAAKRTEMMMEWAQLVPHVL